MTSIPRNMPAQASLFSLFGTNDTITCFVCGKELQKISFTHLGKHGMSFDDYRHMFPNAPLTNDSNNRNTRIKFGITKSCVVCGKAFYVKPCNVHNAKFCSQRCHGIESSVHIRTRTRPSNSEHPLWRGGRQYYYGPTWIRQQKLARERDNHTCQMCGKIESENKRKLDVHHIQDFREFGLEHSEKANQLNNLVALCRRCHSHVTNGIATWPPSN